jgi:hypothetical protein
MIAFIKFVHSLVFMVLCGSLGLLAFAAATGNVSRWTWIATASLVFEIGAVAASRGACPLTIYAEKLGAASGSVVEWFLPRWLAVRAFEVGGGLFLLSMFVLSIRLAIS